LASKRAVSSTTFGVPKARPWIAGLAAGVAGHLLLRAVMPAHDVAWMAFDQIWLIASAAVCAFLAHAVLRK
jgi:hypothetical protein